MAQGESAESDNTTRTSCGWPCRPLQVVEL